MKVLSIIKRSLPFFLISALVGLCFPSQSGATPYDENWDTSFALGGVIGQIKVLFNTDDQILVGGEFQTADLTPLNNIAQYDPATRTYAPMGDGIDTGVTAITLYNGQPVVSQLVPFDQDPIIQRIYIWDGIQWSRLGNTLPEAVNSLAVLDGVLYAGRYRWQDNQWIKILFGPGRISCQMVWNEGLICSGSFDEINGVPANGIAAWDGVSATPLAAGLNGHVNHLCIHNGALIASGTFDGSGALPMNAAASWDGTQWTNLDLPPLPPYGSAYSSHVSSFQDKLVARVLYPGPWSPVYQALFMRQDGGDWTRLDENEIGVRDNIYAFCQSGDNLLMGGKFGGMNDVASSNLIGYDGTDWFSAHDTGLGLSNTAWAMCVFDGQLITAGHFCYAGTTATGHAAAFDGQQWSAMDSADLEGNPHAIWGMTWIEVLIAGENQLYSDIVRLVGDYAIGYLGQWDETTTTWQGTQSDIIPACIFDGDLYGYQYGSIHRREAEQWTQLPYVFSGFIYDMLDWNDQLVVAGSFTSVDDEPAGHVVSFGHRPQYFNGGLPGPVSRLSTFDGALVAVHSMGQNSYVSVWDGQTWVQLGEGFTGQVYCVQQYGDHLYAGGKFTAVDNQAARNLSWWTGQDWRPYGRGVGWGSDDSSVQAMAVYDDKLYMTGTFSTAGNVSAGNIACLLTPRPTATQADDTPVPGTGLDFHANVPNPFNPLTTLAFSLPKTGHVCLAIYDIQGRLVTKLVDQHLEAGTHSYTWDGSDSDRRQRPSGVYLARIMSDSGQQTRKLTLVR